jgi:predicted DNA-binding transcriptional regulator AlpA
MSTDEFQSQLPMAATNLKVSVSISKWVNEAYPRWDEILSAHDVARLTRRHRWVLTAMAVLRRFPRKRKFHGRPLGWHRGDVVRWLTTSHSRPSAPQRTSTRPLPFAVPEDCLNRQVGRANEHVSLMVGSGGTGLRLPFPFRRQVPPVQRRRLLELACEGTGARRRRSHAPMWRSAEGWHMSTERRVDSR